MQIKSLRVVHGLDQIRLSGGVGSVQHGGTNKVFVGLVDLDQVVGVVGQFGAGDHVQRHFLAERAEVADGERNQHGDVAFSEMPCLPRSVENSRMTVFLVYYR